MKIGSMFLLYTLNKKLFSTLNYSLINIIASVLISCLFVLNRLRSSCHVFFVGLWLGCKCLAQMEPGLRFSSNGNYFRNADQLFSVGYLDWKMIVFRRMSHGGVSIGLYGIAHSTTHIHRVLESHINLEIFILLYFRQE